MGNINIDKCSICGKKSFYVLEWYGLNQHLKDPLVVQDIGSCSNFEHMVEILKSDFLNEYDHVDGIVDYKTLEKEHKKLTDIVNRVYHENIPKNDYLYNLGQELIYRDLSPTQKMLFI